MLGILLLGGFGIFVGDLIRGSSATSTLAAGDPLILAIARRPAAPAAARAGGRRCQPQGSTARVQPIAGLALAEVAPDEHRDPAVVPGSWATARSASPVRTASKNCSWIEGECWIVGQRSARATSWRRRMISPTSRGRPVTE